VCVRVCACVRASNNTLGDRTTRAVDERYSPAPAADWFLFPGWLGVDRAQLLDRTQPSINVRTNVRAAETLQRAYLSACVLLVPAGQGQEFL